MRRVCRYVQERLPRLVDGTIPALQARLLRRHVDRCDACAAELDRQQTVTHGLEALGEAPRGPQADPPEELLTTILERLQDPGLRERAAVPARGAVSGARPGLSLAGVLLAFLALYVAWRAAQRAVDRHLGPA